MTLLTRIEKALEDKKWKGQLEENELECNQFIDEIFAIVRQEFAKPPTDEAVTYVAKEIALNLGWEWGNPHLKAGTDSIPSQREFKAAARAAITTDRGIGK